MTSPQPSPIRNVEWTWNPETNLITGQVQGDERSMVIITMPADPPAAE